MALSWLSIAFHILLAVTVVHGEIFNDPAHVLSREYDFVVIGGAYPTAMQAYVST